MEKSKKEQFYKNRLFWLVLIGIVSIALVIFGVSKIDTNTQTDDNKTTVLQNVFAIALRKCAVMEAVDIYEPGEYGNQNSVFDFTLESCFVIATDAYNNDVEAFIYDVNESWATKKDEQIDGKNLEYYLDSLDWQN